MEDFAIEHLLVLVEDTPNGYPRLAAFQSSEANFGLYRSFSYLHSRILLDLQEEITTLESDLDELDLDDEQDAPERLQSREVDEERSANDTSSRTRRVILREIRLRLMEYGKSDTKLGLLSLYPHPTYAPSTKEKRVDKANSFSSSSFLSNR